MTTTKKLLPTRRYHKTPRPLWSDAYTINGFKFESKDATDNSIYYATFRKFPLRHEPFYDPSDERIVFAGLQSLVDMIFYDPITHEEIDETMRFLEARKATMTGFRNFEFPEELWRRVVRDCGGYLPLKIEGAPEGAVVYPNEPVMRVSATKPGFGPLVPWFESTLLHVWAATERLTAARHFLRWTYDLIRKHEPVSTDNDACMNMARLMIHDFGDRAAACPQESELVGKVHNYVFFGTDSFRAAYQNWKNGAPPAYGSSVKALAHRIVQGFEREFDCYETMYNTAENGEFLSMVADCYDYWNALENALIPLALRAKSDGSGKVIVARPDSGDSKEMVLGTLQRADKAGLMAKMTGADGKIYKISTTLRFIVGNGESYHSCMEIMQACLDAGFMPWRCGIFGVGGHLRNNINRDHLSTKFALCAVGKDNRPVIKLSEEPGKRTLPMVVVLRDKYSLQTGETIVLPVEQRGHKDLCVLYCAPSNLGNPFMTEGFEQNFLQTEYKVIKEFDTMPKTAGKMSQLVKDEVDTLVKTYRK